MSNHRDRPDAEELSAGPALDLAMQRVLRADCEKCGFAPHYIERFCGRVKPWSTNIMLTMSLIDEIRYMFLQSVVRLSADSDEWRCLIEGTTRDGEYWYCEASGRTLPEAFCRAWVQVKADDDLPSADPAQWLSNGH